MSKTFIAELKRVASKKTVSNDIEASILLVTNDTEVMDLGKIKPEQLVKVTIEEYNGEY
jgi:hypothetical protein